MSVIAALAGIGVEEERKARKKGRQYCEPELSMLSAASGKTLPLDKSTAPRPNSPARPGLRLGDAQYLYYFFHIFPFIYGVCLSLAGYDVLKH